MKTVNDVLRLYYSTRCVIAHGVAAKTVIEGCLRDFPSVEELKAGKSYRRRNVGVISTTETGWEGGGGAVSRVVYDVPFFLLLGQPPYGCSGNGVVGHLEQTTCIMEAYHILTGEG